jgi:hypothetical protein
VSVEEVLAHIATVAFGIAGVVAAYYGYKSFRASHEQLELRVSRLPKCPKSS